MRTSTKAVASAIRSGMSQPGDELGGRCSRASNRSLIPSGSPTNVATGPAASAVTQAQGGGDRGECCAARRKG